MFSYDPSDMSGNHLRDEISARADGEDPGLSDEEIDAHLESCESCRAFAETVHDLRRRMSLVPMPDVSDRSRQVVDSIVRDERRRSSTVIRAALAGCALIVIGVAVPDFISTQAAAHSLRHIAAFRLAYGAGLLGVVARPARARTMFYVSIVLVIALVSTSVVDAVRDGLDLVTESLHLVQVLAAILLWLLARPRPAEPDAVSGPGFPDPSDGDDQPIVDVGPSTGRVLPLHKSARPSTRRSEHRET